MQDFTIKSDYNMLEKITKPIDFVITWVDGSDKNWLAEKKTYQPTIDVDDSSARYRDFGTLKYLLRSIDKFAPWVRNIFLVTNGQVPNWLDKSNNKLKIVKHTEFMPSEYLPTFSSHPIEWNLHKIDGLSENFVYFNDDMILVAPVLPEDFFKQDLPCDTFGLGLVRPVEFFSHIPFNHMMVINKHFNLKKTLKSHKEKMFCLKYGKRLIKTCLLANLNVFYGMYDHHVAISFKKSAFNLLWEKEYNLIHSTCKNKFRSKDDVSIWLVRYWQLLTGEFVPRSEQFGKFYVIHDFIHAENVKNKLKKSKAKIICFNDNENSSLDFEEERKKFTDIMDSILGDKCQYEL